MTFSFTVMFRKSRIVWNVRATPRLAIAFVSSPTMLSPSSRISPSSGS
jgi:hypothetical protein